MVLATPFELDRNRIDILKSAFEKGIILMCTKTPYGDVWQVKFPDGGVSVLFQYFEDAWNLLTTLYYRYSGKRKEGEVVVRSD